MVLITDSLGVVVNRLAVGTDQVDGVQGDFGLAA
ncbi:MAG: hypothetical protein BWY71_02187 [Planctomycetes bacterium ADurb.Bin412]|nr:MAG: hypothetical protein BWY71_02187 [Planctomycetes bacterium ADurb.Bin412]